MVRLSPSTWFVLGLAVALCAFLPGKASAAQYVQGSNDALTACQDSYSTPMGGTCNFKGIANSLCLNHFSHLVPPLSSADWEAWQHNSNTNRIVCWNTQAPTCTDGPRDSNTGECPAPSDPCQGIAEGVEQPDGSCFDCALSGNQFRYSELQVGGTGPADAYQSATAYCSSSKVDAKGCSLECDGGPPPASDCWIISTDPFQMGCPFDLRTDGTAGEAGAAVQDPDSERELESTDSTDPDGCVTDSTTTSRVNDLGDGRVERCVITTTFNSSLNAQTGTCEVTQGSESESCTTEYSDGSKVETESDRQLDGAGNVLEESINETTKPPDVGEQCKGTSCDDDPEPEADIGAGCGSPPQCTGDPVGCAQLELQWAEACALENSMDDLDLSGEPSIPTSSTDFGAQADAWLTGTGGFIANETCPTPLTFSVVGSQQTFDWQWLCDIADILGSLVIAVAVFIGGRIVFGG